MTESLEYLLMFCLYMVPVKVFSDSVTFNLTLHMRPSRVQDLLETTSG